jgi:hypothetical protein
MCHFVPVGRIALLFVLIAARPGDRLVAQGSSSQPAVQRSPIAPVSKAPDPCAYRRDCIAKLLIDRGANVNLAAGNPKRTPLEVARLQGDVQLEKMLLEKGAKSGS